MVFSVFKDTIVNSLRSGLDVISNSVDLSVASKMLMPTKLVFLIC